MAKDAGTLVLSTVSCAAAPPAHSDASDDHQQK